MDLDVSSKEYMHHITAPILLGAWIMFFIFGFISLIDSIINQNLEFIWFIFFSNLLSLIPYAIMFFPTLSIFIILRDYIEKKEIKEKPKIFTSPRGAMGKASLNE